MQGTGPVLPPGVVISSAGRRFAGVLLDVVLAIVTFGIGWFIWALITFKDGQTPGKKLLKMRMVKAETGIALGWGMSFVREFIIKGVIASFTFGIAYLWILFDSNNQSLYDKILGVHVVDDPNEATLERNQIVAPAASAPTTTEF